MNNFKISSKVILTSIAIVVISSTSALAGNYVTLEAPVKKDVILNLGDAPAKKKIKLNLGDLRKDEAQLPAGTRSLFDRMRMRAKRALDRQKAVAHASRRRAESNQSKNSFVETDFSQSGGDNDDYSEEQVIE